jgi:hypothetical protein
MRVRHKCVRLTDSVEHSVCQLPSTILQVSSSYLHNSCCNPVFWPTDPHSQIPYSLCNPDAWFAVSNLKIWASRNNLHLQLLGGGQHKRGLCMETCLFRTILRKAGNHKFGLLGSLCRLPSTCFSHCCICQGATYKAM